MAEDVIIVGGGQAGLATAYYLRKVGIDPLIVDDSQGPGGGWRHVWPSMTLFSTSDFSSLPGMQMPSYNGFPPAQHVIDYFTAYEKRYKFRIKRPDTVKNISYRGTDRDGVFHVELSQNAIDARHVIAATGNRPFIPHYPGTTTAQQWHSYIYPGPEPFRGSRVAVVGAANSGAQIAAELALSDADVTWYTRHAPRYMPDDVDGRVLFRRNRARALAIARGEPDPGADSNLGDIVVLPHVRRARDAGLLQHTPMFTSLDELEVDHLIWCTGFRPAISLFRQLPRINYVGYGDWVGPGAATIVGVGPFARQAAESASSQLSRQ